MGCATDILLIAQGINHDFSIIDATENGIQQHINLRCSYNEQSVTEKNREALQGWPIMPVLLKKHTNC